LGVKTEKEQADREKQRCRVPPACDDQHPRGGQRGAEKLVKRINFDRHRDRRIKLAEIL